MIWGRHEVSSEHDPSPGGCVVLPEAGTWHPHIIPSPTCQGFNPCWPQHGGTDTGRSPAPRDAPAPPAVGSGPKTGSVGPLPQHTATSAHLFQGCSSEQTGHFASLGHAGPCPAPELQQQGTGAQYGAGWGNPGVPEGHTGGCSAVCHECDMDTLCHRAIPWHRDPAPGAAQGSIQPLAPLPGLLQALC